MNIIPESLYKYINENIHNIKIDIDFNIIGIKNIGNTCYLNSILQIILNTNELVEFFKDTKYIMYILNYIKNNLLEQNQYNNYSKLINKRLSTISHQFHSLINSKNKILNLSEFKKNFDNIDKKLEFYKLIQHDAMEALDTILERIHNELENEIEIEYSINIDFIKEAIEINYKKSYSIIEDLFSYLEIMSLKCNECNYISKKIDKNRFLILELPTDNNKISLYDILNLYHSEEILDDLNKYYCSNCNNKINAIKKISFLMLPKILIIQIKRFDRKLNKLDHYVDFPLKNLDLTSYIHESTNEINKNNLYNLYGVVNHIGSFNKGHYFTFIFKNNNWFSISDDNINIIDESKIISKNAYILFYKLSQ